MRSLRDALRGPNREYTLILALAGLIGALALVAALRPSAHRPPAARGASTAISAPGPVIGTKPIPSAAPALTPAQLAAASLAARRFLAGYLGYLYGRTRAREVRDVDSGLRAILARHPARITPAQRRRHPRLLALDVEPRGGGLATATATVTDGSGAPYPVRFILGHEGGGWVVERILP